MHLYEESIPGNVTNTEQIELFQQTQRHQIMPYTKQQRLETTSSAMHQ